MAEQHLDLFEFAARSPAQLRSHPAQVVQCDVRHADGGNVGFQHLPDDFLTQPTATNLIVTFRGRETNAPVTWCVRTAPMPAWTASAVVPDGVSASSTARPF